MVNRRLVKQVAHQLHQETTSQCKPEVIVPEPARKRSKCEDPTLALFQTMVPPTSKAENNPSGATSHERAEAEIKFYKNIEHSQWPKFKKTLEWRISRCAKKNLPCLSQVVQAFLACMPSSGGLECDFGSIKDVLKPKRAALGQGFIEVEMMLKLKKHLSFSNLEKVRKLSNAMWTDSISKRLVFPGDDVDDESTDSTPTMPNK